MKKLQASKRTITALLSAVLCASVLPAPVLAQEFEEVLPGQEEAKPSGQVIYRLYNPNSSEHFYTISEPEKNALVDAGWKEEDSSWIAPEQGDPIYRLYNPNAGDHHYTRSEQEKDALCSYGWKDEGIAFYSENEYGRSIYRLYNPNAKSGSHHYTPSKREADYLEAQGWKQEGRAFFSVSEYTFEPQEDGSVLLLDLQGEPASGRISVYDEWYLCDEQGIVQTGWIDDEEQNRLYFDQYGRQALGKTKIEEDWYGFDEETGAMHADALVKYLQGECYFSSDGKAQTGRIFYDGDLGYADEEDAFIVWKDYGWKDNPNRHLLLERESSLALAIDAWKEEGIWIDPPADEAMQEAAAEIKQVQEVLALQEYEEVHSVYNPNTGEHFLSQEMQEVEYLAANGWKDEGVKMLMAKQSDTPVWRLYHSSKGHHYTKSAQEKEALEKEGWIDEGIRFYEPKTNLTPVWRLCNPNAKESAHHFTISKKERDALVRLGWRSEGEGWKSMDLTSFVAENGITKAYDHKDEQLLGLQTIVSDRYYFDPAQDGAMKTGRAVIEQNGRSMKVLFGEDGKMFFGERNTAQGVEYYDENTGEQAVNRWLEHSNPKKICWYDANGYRAYGRRTIGNRQYYFDESGALAPDYQALKEMVSSRINARKLPGEQIAFALRVPGKDSKIILNSKPQQSASVMKAFVMGAICENFDQYAARYGVAYLDGQLAPMISVSSNDAWVNLVTVLGYGNYAAGLNVLRNWNRSHGYNDTQMMGVPYGNYTSAADASKILCDIQEGKLKNSAKMKALLRTQRVPGRMLQGLPGEAITGNKPGWVNGCENDTVLVDAPFGTYVVTLLCDQMQSSTRAQQLMAEVSPMVYQWMKENMNLGSKIPQ